MNNLFQLILVCFGCMVSANHTILVVLGCADSNIQQERVNSAMDYINKSNTNIKLYVSGGVKDAILSNKETEASRMAKSFEDKNIELTTLSNYESLLFGTNDNYTLNMADYVGATISSNGKTVALTKTTLTENPILVKKVITIGTKKIGYLMYNGFYADFDLQLNTAFGDFKTQGITDLVLVFLLTPI